MSIKSMPVWKWVLLLIASFVLALLMYSLSQALTYAVGLPWLRCLLSVVVAAVMIGLYAVFVNWFERQPARDIPLHAAGKDFGIGLVIGMLFFVAVVGLMWAFGLYKVTAAGTDQPGAIVMALFHCLITAVGEEILFRGVLFRWIDEKWGFVWALIISSLLFGVMHIANPGATWWSSLAIVIEAGLLLGAAYKWSGTLWLPIGIHWAWNFFQGNIFGFAVSGGNAGVSLLQSTVQGPDILTGGPFGAEASILTVLLGAALSLWFILKVARNAAIERPQGK